MPVQQVELDERQENPQHEEGAGAGLLEEHEALQPLLRPLVKVVLPDPEERVGEGAGQQHGADLEGEEGLAEGPRVKSFDQDGKQKVDQRVRRRQQGAEEAEDVHFVSDAADLGPGRLVLVVDQRRGQVQGGYQVHPGRDERHRAPQRLVVGFGRGTLIGCFVLKSGQNVHFVFYDHSNTL